MRTSQPRRVAGLITAVLLASGGLTVVTTHAYATTTSPVTSTLLGVKDVLSGVRSFHLNVRVTNPLSAGNTAVANYIRVTVPPELTVLSGSGNGWKSHVRDARSVEFDAPALPAGQAPVVPGEAADFDVQVSAATVAQDTFGSLEVSMSSDAGTTIIDTTPATTKALSTRVYVIRLAPPAINFLTGAGKATAGQSNLTMTATAENHGSADLTVAISATGTNGDALGTVAPVLVPAGSSHAFILPAVFGDPGVGRTIDVSASSSGGGAGRSTDPFDVQAPVAFAYDGSAPMTPGYGRSGGWAGFSLLINKTGDQEFTMAPTTRLTFVNTSDASKTFSVPLGYSTYVSAGSVDKRYGFNDITVPGNPALGNYDGQYAATLTVDGVDGNGNPLTVSVPVSTTYTIDSLAPVAAATLSTAHHVGKAGGASGDPAQPFVAKNGDTLTFGGKIFQSATSSQPDPSATVYCVVDYLKAGDLVGQQSVGCSNSAGTLTGQASLIFPGGTDAADLRVAATDAVGNTSTTTSNTIVVDNAVPQLLYARTGAGGATPQSSDETTVRILLSEPVVGSFNPADFSVHNANSTGSFPVVAAWFDGSDTTYGQTLVLTTGSPFGPDDTPLVDYHGSSVPTPPQDGAGNVMVLSSLTAVDGIAPPLPRLTLVDSKATDTADGAFYVNEPSPTFSLANLAAGNVASVYLDSNGTPGLQPATDTLLCSVKASGPSATCNNPSTSLPADGTYTLLVRAVDPSGNVSTGSDGSHWTTASLVLDRVAPTLAGFQATATGGVLATFSEPVVSGRDVARDWSVYNGPVAFVVGTVQVADRTDRKLTIDSSGWAGLATRLRYVFGGTDPTQRYTDRAGNVMLDQAYDPTTGVTLITK